MDAIDLEILFLSNIIIFTIDCLEDNSFAQQNLNNVLGCDFHVMSYRGK
jgi:hypothetical protein